MPHKTIKNVKSLQAKSRDCIVSPTDCEHHVTVQSTTGAVYDVWFNHTGNTTCSCKWGAYRPSFDPRSGCAHALAAHNFIAHKGNRRVYAWSADDKAAIERQHRPSFSIGDGVVLTTRKLSSL